MITEVRPCSHRDIEFLRLTDIAPSDRRHHEERWCWQQRQEAVYLLAWRGDRVVGRATLLTRSKYPEVRLVFPALAEINALEARPQRQGIGTALVQAAECEARNRAFPMAGMAVEVINGGARRLYRRLGYDLWAGGRVIDRWTARDDDGQVVGEQADECVYLTKRLS